MVGSFLCTVELDIETNFPIFYIQEGIQTHSYVLSQACILSSSTIGAHQQLVVNGIDNDGLLQ